MIDPHSELRTANCELQTLAWRMAPGEASANKIWNYCTYLHKYCSKYAVSLLSNKGINRESTVPYTGTKNTLYKYNVQLPLEREMASLLQSIRSSSLSTSSRGMDSLLFIIYPHVPSSKVWPINNQNSRYFNTEIHRYSITASCCMTIGRLLSKSFGTNNTVDKYNVQLPLLVSTHCANTSIEVRFYLNWGRQKTHSRQDVAVLLCVRPRRNRPWPYPPFRPS